MFTRDSKRFLTSVSIALAVLLANAGQGMAQFEFGEPKNLGLVVNSSTFEGGPSIDADGLTLFFSSERPGGFGLWDLWMTTRSSVLDPWPPPVNLGTLVNSSSWDYAPSISADGLTLYFGSARAGGGGTSDLWATTRISTTDPWQPPVILGPTINTGSENGPNISADGLTLFFQSPRPGGFGLSDIWITTRASPSDPWEPPVNLGPTVNTSYHDRSPTISTDGRTLFFGSDRPGGFGGDDIWMTTRASTADPWQSPVNLGNTVNTSSNDGTPDISANGSTLFFRSDRPGGSGDLDLWQVAVMSTCPADLNGDGGVNAADLALLLGSWGPCAGCPADFNGDDVVNAADLALLLGSWGSCPCTEC